MIRMSMNTFVVMVFVGVGLVGCGSKTISECSADSDCKNLAYPFCDVNGEFPTSGGNTNVCTIIPPPMCQRRLRQSLPDIFVPMGGEWFLKRAEVTPCS